MYMNKNIARLRDLKKELGTRCHGRRFRVWRWKQAVAQCIGEKWCEEAQSNTGWRGKTRGDDILDKTEVGGSSMFRDGITRIQFMLCAPLQMVTCAMWD